MKLIPTLLLLAAAAAPASLGAQAASALPLPDAADTLKAVEVSAVEKRPSFADRAEVARIVEASYPGGLREARVAGTVVVRVVVDAHGRPLLPRVARPSGNPQLDRAGLRAVRQMRFVPAELGGAPHPVWVELPVSFVPPDPDAVDGAPPEQVRAWADSAGALAPSAVDERPVVRDAQEAMRILNDAYPPALQAARVGGNVTVWFVVGPGGEAAAARVTRSAGNAELDAAALRAVGRLRFRPARRGGQPVAAWTTFPAEFRVPEEPRDPAPDSLGAYEMSEVDDLPVLRNRGEVVSTIARAYPPALREARVTGVVIARFLVDVDGVPVPGTVAVEDSDHPGFAAPAVQVVEKMRFQPARVDGRRVPVWVVLPIQFSLRR